MSSGGARNEPARARRRKMMKTDQSLTSIPQEYDEPIYTLANHFGWRVLQKTQVGDGIFPHIAQHLEKPTMTGNDFRKVTYVLYVDEAERAGFEKDTDLKATQTGLSLTENAYMRKPEKKKGGGFCCGKGKKKTKGDSIDRVPSKERKDSRDEDIEFVDVDQYDETPTEPREKTKKQRGKGPGRWVLRAGAENVKCGFEGEIDETDQKIVEGIKTESKVMDSLDYGLFKRREPIEQVLPNKYLYVPRQK